MGRTNRLAHAAKTHGDHEGPCPPCDAGDDLPDEADGEEGEEEGVGTQRRGVSVDCGFDRTGGVDVDAEARVDSAVGGPVGHGG